jgi:hypothetical protein
MDLNRRKFLKIIVVGGGTFVAGKLLEPFLKVPKNELLSRNDSTFRMSDDKQSLAVHDENGEEILLIDNTE